MSHLNERIKKLEEVTPIARPGIGVAIPQDGETEEQAIARVRASKPCRKVYLVQFVDALPRNEDGAAGTVTSIST
ncbi:hypothetical protein [Hydrogenophaga aquatica]